MFFRLIYQVSGGGFDGFRHLSQNRAGLLGNFLGSLGGILTQMLDPFALEQFFRLLLEFLGSFPNLLGGSLG